MFCEYISLGIDPSLKTDAVVSVRFMFLVHFPHLKVRGQLSSLQANVQTLAAARAAAARPSGLAGLASHILSGFVGWIDASATDAVSLGLSLAHRIVFDSSGAPSTQRASPGQQQLLLEGPSGATAPATGDDGYEREQARVAAQLTKFVGAGMTLLAVEIAFRGLFRKVSPKRWSLRRCVSVADSEMPQLSSPAPTEPTRSSPALRVQGRPAGAELPYRP